MVRYFFCEGGFHCLISFLMYLKCLLIFIYLLYTYLSVFVLFSIDLIYLVLTTADLINRTAILETPERLICKLTDMIIQFIGNNVSEFPIACKK